MGKSEAPWLGPGGAADSYKLLRRRAVPLLGSLVEMAVLCESDAAFEHASSGAFEVVSEVHRAMSFHNMQSDVRRIGRAAAGTVLQLNPHTWQVLYMARRLELDSGGLFNVTVAHALVARCLLPRPVAARKPVASGLLDGLALLDKHRVRIMQPLWIDLGGIAKGYAVDCAVKFLQASGAAAGLVNAGGDMRAFGSVVQPVHLRFQGRLMRVANLQDGALASSSNAELSESETPHIDPRNGCGACSAQTVVVQARCAAVADALTKVALLCPVTADKLCLAWQASWRGFAHNTTTHRNAQQLP